MNGSIIWHCSKKNACMYIIILFIYNVPVPVLRKRAPSTVQLHISDVHMQTSHLILHDELL